MYTPTEYQRWLLNQIERLTDWSKPMTTADLPGKPAEVVELDEEWPGPELSVFEDAADIVREAGEIALRLGLPDLYRMTRVPSPMLAIPNAKELLGHCLAACNAMLKDAGLPATPDVPIADTKPSKRPEPSFTCQRAFGQYLKAEQALGTVTDRQAYIWVRREEDGQLPPFPTWTRYVRRGRQCHNMRKNSPRAGRTGGSIVSTHQLDSARGDSDDG